VKDNSVRMPCILAPTTFSYNLNAIAQLRANSVKNERSEEPHIARLLQRSLAGCSRS